MLHDIVDQRQMHAGAHAVSARIAPVYQLAEPWWNDSGPRTCSVSEAVRWALAQPFEVDLFLADAESDAPADAQHTARPALLAPAE